MTRTCALIVAEPASRLDRYRTDHSRRRDRRTRSLVVEHGRDGQPRPHAIGFELGWPGISFSYLHGTSDRTDSGPDSTCSTGSRTQPTRLSAPAWTCPSAWW